MPRFIKVKPESLEEFMSQPDFATKYVRLSGKSNVFREIGNYVEDDSGALNHQQELEQQQQEEGQ